MKVAVVVAIGTTVLIAAAALVSQLHRDQVEQVVSDNSGPALATDDSRGVAAALEESNGASTGVGATGSSSDTRTLASESAEQLAATADHTEYLRGIARSGLRDDEFEAVAALLAADPSFAELLVEEARAETDPERLDVLARMIGEADDDVVVEFAAEFVYSGDRQSRILGLGLLKRVEGGNPEALAIVSGVLVNDTEPDYLVPALTALARPAVTERESHAGLVEQVAFLANHTDASVRRTSIDILGRWTDDTTYTALLVSGLADEDQWVRRASAFALIDHGDNDPVAVEGLLQVAMDEVNERSTRRGALRALEGLGLSPEQQRQYAAVKLELTRR